MPPDEINNFSLANDNYSLDFTKGSSAVQDPTTSSSLGSNTTSLSAGTTTAYFNNGTVSGGATVPIVPVENVPQNEWVALYDGQVYISSDLVTSYYQRSDGESLMFKENSSTNAVDIYDLTNGADTLVGSMPLDDLSNMQYAYNGSNLEAACAIGYAGVLAVATAAGFSIYGTLQSGWVMNFFGPIGTGVYVGSAVIAAGIGAYGAYKTLCRL